MASASGWLGLHGFTGAPESLSGLFAADGAWLCPWLAGHGPRPPRATSFVSEVERLEELALRELTPPLGLFGYSLGARLALGLLVRARVPFASAVLVGVNPGLGTDEERRERRAREAPLRALLHGENLPGFVAAWQEHPLLATGRALPPERLEAQRQQRLGHTAAGLAHALDVLGLASMPDYWPELGRLDLPVTLVVGERDEKFRKLGHSMLRLLPRARLVIAPGVGHNVVLEAPDFIQELLSEEENDR